VTTWADVKQTIGVRLNRPNLDPTLIQMFAEERADVLSAKGFFPSEQTDVSITTNPGQYFYLLARGITNIQFVRFLLSSIWIPLSRARSIEDILMADPVQPSFTAIPSSGRVFGRLIRLFPTPNGQYPLELTVTRRVDIPTDDNDDQNFWVNEGRAIIVAEVCKHYALQVIHNKDWVADFTVAGEEAKDSMDDITSVRNGPTIVRPYL
jgi:hypothetical protein